MEKIICVKDGRPYFRYDNPKEQGLVGIEAKGKWYQGWRDRKYVNGMYAGETYRAEFLGTEKPHNAE